MTGPVSREPKAAGAFRTIGELARETGLPAHVLRYWESHFPQLRPVQRAGNRRYYRPADVALVRRIDTLLNRDGYTIRGVQQVLATDPSPPDVPPPADPRRDALIAIRRLLAQALHDDGTR